MSVDHRLSTEKITPELIDYIVEKIVQEIQPEKIILYSLTNSRRHYRCWSDKAL